MLEVDHHSITYDVVALRMHIEADICQAHRLRLGIAPDEPSFVWASRETELSD